MIPCHPGCPNATEPVPKYRCRECGGSIFEGDKYLDGPKGYVCEGCLEDMTIKELLKMLGESLATA